MATTYSVTAPLVLAKNEQGGVVYIYQGGQVPAGQSDDWIEQHLRSKMIVKGDYVPEAQQAPDSDAAPAADEKPSGNASHDEWAAYAVSQGMSQDEAEALSRNELRDLYA